LAVKREAAQYTVFDY